MQRVVLCPLSYVMLFSGVESLETHKDGEVVLFRPDVLVKSGVGTCVRT
jgi:hypothetical protein